MAEIFRYAAFISYSSKDAGFTRKLHRVLEHYLVPKSLGTFDLIGGGKPNRIYPVFRDREELPTGELDDLIKASLAASAKLVVVCSTHSVESRWVNKEIEHFCSLGRAGGVHAIIAEDVAETTKAAEVLPPALREVGLSPVAADARKVKDGFRNAWLKLVAGLVGVAPGQLLDRDKRRRMQQRAMRSAAAACLAILIAGSIVIVDTLNTRADFTSFASRLASEGLPLEAAAFALAGLPAPGDVVRIAHPNAAQAVRASGANVRLIAEVDAYAAAVSGDARFLAWVSEDGKVWLRDTDSADAPVEVGAGANVFFSPDNRFLAIADREGRSQLRFLDGQAAPISLGDADPIFGFEFARDGRWLIVRDEAGSSRLWDLSGVPAGRALGRVAAFFSPDGRYLLTYDASGFGAVRDLHDANARLVEIGPLSTGDSQASYGFSHDSRFFLYRDAFGGGMLIDLRNPQQEIYLGPVRRFAFAANAPVLATQRDAFETTIHRLDRVSAPVELGRLAFFELSGDGRFAAGLHRERDGTLYDTETGRVAAALGELELTPQLAFSADGRYFGYRTSRGEGVLRDLRQGSDAALGPVTSGGLQFTEDSRFLVIHGEGYFATLRVLDDGGMISLGPIQSFGFSEDGRFLLISPFEEERTIVHDLAVAPAQGSGGNLRSQICRMNQETLRPFRQSERRSGGEAGLIYRRLRGRPWNPCDWRGLFAFENNWEGLQQWRRMIGVRFFNEADYACGEVNAGGATDPARLEACARAQRETPELWRPTAHPSL